MKSAFLWQYAFDYFPKILRKVPTTLSIVLAATILGIILGVIIAFLRLEKVPILNILCKLFVSFSRGTPILIQMFVVYYALPALFAAIGIHLYRWEKIYYLYITYGLNTGAYFSEIFRSAILSVPKSQMDAAAAVGMTKFNAYFRIIIPQSIIIAIPSVGAMIAALLQDSSLGFAFGIIDVIGQVNVVGTRSTRILEGYFDAAIIFSVLTIVIEKLFGFIESKTRYQKLVSKQ
ncbi:ABC-type amino acid transport system, permease component [Treponema primitia ZAS-2]|uniref:ABC-type amino acid transport system, permease component n=1 Tax=Treponema primitia (strain ATCC BAA-887 / DSM 12427 / ZAS-2) TaxID=545694 RepID=F5YK77_TREPZ|nr:ABC transporter permease subunit [Treponema primitia]AEF84301.1 ABC-type amino acid transport system, permease component [Treponema primitia ZAS-2]